MNQVQDAAVLLVDDLPQHLMALTALLEPLRLQVVTARSGEDAIRQLQGREFAVILLDVQMPSMDGFAVAELVRGRERLRATPIMFVTAHDLSPETLLWGYQLGAVDFLVKPLLPQLVRAKVGAFVEQYRVRRELAQLSRERDLILNAMSEGIVGLDPHGLVTFVNQAAAALTGWAMESLRGQPLHALLHHAYPDGTSYPTASSPIQLTLRSGSTQTIAGEVFWRQDGSCFPVSYTSRALIEQGAIIGAVVTFVDLTPHRLLEEQLRESKTAYTEIEEALRLRDQFLSVATHEIRTPITSMLGYAQLLQRRFARDQRLSERDQRAFDSLADQVGRLHELTSGLLDLSGLQNGHMRLEMQALDLGGLVRELVEEMRQVVRHEIMLEVSEAPAEIAGDAIRVRQIITNLLSNAAKYSPEGGAICVQVSAEGQAVRVVVRDEGIGIPAEDLPRLFKLFYRAHNARAREIGGVGVGLAVVKELVTLHDGTISVHSQEGQGTTFVLSFPILTDLDRTGGSV